LDILAVLLENSRFYTNFILFFFTVASFFYYLRVIKIIFFDQEKEFAKREFKGDERLWLVAVLFLILLFYMFLVQKPLLAIQTEALSAIL
jgi:NADH:ubiquinone oxidoreductase subunit 2 (subunit N)